MTELIEDAELRRYVTDPKTLTHAEKAALTRIHTEPLRRMYGGFGRRGNPRVISLDMVSRLMGRGLVHIITTRNGRVVDTTHQGKETMRLAMARKRSKS